ncbi:PIN domain-containing protein [Mucilaginibacter sp. PAMB04168]|uniref:PIN domain-containing protein n=1 Tax=Mucilaginibacter sp. PAMB04168 TaxID=3138567 RepID=UPI0031F68810
MHQLFVIDTVGFINYFNAFFGEKRILSARASNIIDKCLSPDFPNYKLIIPSIVLIEVFEKQLRTDERSEEFKYTILKPLIDNSDVEIKGIEEEVVEVFSRINDYGIKIENHDKIILSSALQMEVPLITKDGKIQSYLNKTKEIAHFF